MDAVTQAALTRLDTEHAESIALLTARGAASTDHPGGTLLAHLRRTARRLEAWGASRELVSAGLCHAAYGTQGFPTPLFDVARRGELRERLGDEVEAIVYAYGALDRSHQLAQPQGEQVGAGELRDRFSGEYWSPPDRLRRQLAELTAANELDFVQHAELSCDALHVIGDMLSRAAPWLSQAAWSALISSQRLREVLRAGAAPSGDVELAYRDLGATGPRLLLWHGGAGPELTWTRQHALASRFALRVPWRRGFAPSAASARQDWSADVLDLLRIMPERAHVVAHSYGGVSALVAASISPERFGSLVVIEAPLWSIAADDPEIRQLAALGRAFAHGAPQARAAFLALAALPEEHPETAHRTSRARLSRSGRSVPRVHAAPRERSAHRDRFGGTQLGHRAFQRLGEPRPRRGALGGAGSSARRAAPARFQRASFQLHLRCVVSDNQLFQRALSLTIPQCAAWMVAGYRLSRRRRKRQNDLSRSSVLHMDVGRRAWSLSSERQSP